MHLIIFFFFFFFNDTATTEIYTLSLHDALPICLSSNRPPHSRVRLVPCLRSLRATSDASAVTGATAAPARKAVNGTLRALKAVNVAFTASGSARLLRPPPCDDRGHGLPAVPCRRLLRCPRPRGRRGAVRSRRGVGRQGRPSRRRHDRGQAGAREAVAKRQRMGVDRDADVAARHGCRG